MARARAPFAGPALHVDWTDDVRPERRALRLRSDGRHDLRRQPRRPGVRCHAPGRLTSPAIDQKIAALLGTAAADIRITDLAVHPTSKNSFVAVMRGQGTDAKPALVRVDGAGTIDLVVARRRRRSRASRCRIRRPSARTAAAAARSRSPTWRSRTAASSSSGLSNEEFASKLWSVAYPFAAADSGTSVEIYHGNHGQLETRSPVMAFLPLTIDNQPHIVAGYTCTPLVKFPVSSLKRGARRSSARRWRSSARATSRST